MTIELSKLMIMLFKIYYSNKQDKQYDFDYVFDTKVATNIVYNTAVSALVQGLVLSNESSWLVTYGQNNLNKTQYIFKNSDCLFAECILNIFETIDKSEWENPVKRHRRKSKIARSITEFKQLPDNYKLYLSWYQIFNDEVTEDVIWTEWNTINEWHTWRREKIEQQIKQKRIGHLLVTIKIHDENKHRDNELSFLDIVGFDDAFTDRIMDGETDIILDEFSEKNFQWNCHWDLFALRNLLLAIDQARSEGYELNDVSLIEDRSIAKVLSHRLRMDSKIHLISFISKDNESFQQSLNTLEFCLKFKGWLSAEIGRNLNLKVSK
jgi:hypothetical protein